MKLALAIALALLSTPAWAVETPGGVVELLYKEDGAVIAPAKLPRYYSRDMAAALKKDQDEEIGAIGFDWLYGAQDFDIEGLTFEGVADGPDGSLIEARFTNFGKPAAVRWELCRRPNGDWRVVNVASEGWDLRKLLSLPAETTTC